MTPRDVIGAVACCASAVALAACGGGSSPPPTPSPGPHPTVPTDGHPAGCPGQQQYSPTTAPVSPAPVRPPLHTVPEPAGGTPAIVDADNRPVKLVGVNWYGAESADLVPGGLDKHPAAEIAREIKALRFNSVRLPFSNYIVECNPLLRSADRIKAMGLSGPVHALDVYDRVVAALANEGLMVILDDHTSDPEWCCPDPADAIWQNRRYTEPQWIADWVAMAHRYSAVPAVIGADLRNEPSGPAQWGDGGPTDWRRAAELAANAVLSPSGNPRLLVMVEGTRNGRDLSGVGANPICVEPGKQSAYSGSGPCPPGAANDKLVYAPHDYWWYQQDPGATNADYAKLVHELDVTDGWATALRHAPLWVGEFGTCTTSPGCVHSGTEGTWFTNFSRYLAQRRFSWAYWPLNGTQSTPFPSGPEPGATDHRSLGAPETYGLLDASWTAPPPTAADLLCALHSLATGGADPAAGCGQTQPSAANCSLPGGGEGGGALPYMVRGVSCADGGAVVKAYPFSCGTRCTVGGYACRLNSPGRPQPGSPVTCTAGAAAVSFKLAG